MFLYIFKGVSHSNTSSEYMQALGMDQEQINSVLNQQQFELSQNIEKRAVAYKRESDPLFMAAQFDGTPESFNVWKDKVTEIKARYPLPDNA
ncbi:hypothetical protein HJP15_07350 [Pseudoalteromonas sp. NEC-BIFX-2020_002]|uniref:hypothetical protein n=1 Tax=Pseudoalteromonas sp. NEC-BIFX-2020_002 TaxID=2732353 RepID=UPI0014770F67|nr:hypothetical protein [Pseudoalteromonas sp. NEC-BIFX-2020_002]NNG42734.1 hypothetical protein [Pseudoalteromonas sp. NEC-BIFX-2020_002]